MDLNGKMLKKNEGKPLYVLHDGPPYAMGIDRSFFRFSAGGIIFSDFQFAELFLKAELPPGTSDGGRGRGWLFHPVEPDGGDFLGGGSLSLIHI